MNFLELRGLKNFSNALIQATNKFKKLKLITTREYRTSTVYKGGPWFDSNRGLERCLRLVRDAAFQ